MSYFVGQREEHSGREGLREEHERNAVNQSGSAFEAPASNQEQKNSHLANGNSWKSKQGAFLIFFEEDVSELLRCLFGVLVSFVFAAQVDKPIRRWRAT